MGGLGRTEGGLGRGSDCKQRFHTSSIEYILVGLASPSISNGLKREADSHGLQKIQPTLISAAKSGQIALSVPGQPASKVSGEIPSVNCP